LIDFCNQVFLLMIILLNFCVVILRCMLPSLAFSLKSRHKNLRVTDESR
ncbi:unnamed protein product, partial [Ascophyllum nodosum]